MIRLISLLTAFLVCSCIAAPQLSAAIRLTIDGSTFEIEEATFSQESYFSLSELGKALDAEVDWLQIGQRIRFRNDQLTIDLTIDSPFLTMNNSGYNMSLPARLKQGELFVPVATFLHLYNRIASEKLLIGEKGKSLRIERGGYSVSDLTFSARANGMLLELTLTDSLAYDIFVTEGNWVNVSIRNGTVNAAFLEAKRDPRFAHKISVHQQGSTAQVSLQLKQSFTKWHHKLARDPFRIQISIPDLTFTFDSATTKPSPLGDQVIDVIVIDAGHGGKDNGAVGRAGTREKDITLQIAKETARQLRAIGGFSVITTRERDETVSLNERASIANKAQADLFISIHCNANPKRSPRGWNVFFLAPAKNDSARSVEQLENSYFVREVAEQEQFDSSSDTTDPILSILNEMVMTEFQAESQELALLLDNRFRDNLSIPARGVDQAGFFVLNKIFMPSVLVETAFISNPTEEKILKDKSFQAAVATSIVEAVVAFREKYSVSERSDDK